MLVPIHHLPSASFDLSKLGEKNDGDLQDLPPILPRFFVLPLEDKPQNPIMENLRLEESNLRVLRAPRRKAVDRRDGKKEKVVANAVKDENVLDESCGANEVESLWREAAEKKHGVTNSLLSWDRLRPTHPFKASPTAFLSEQNEFVYSSARYHIQPRLHSPTHLTTTATQRELFASLKSTVLGISSQLHTWDARLERFVQVGTEEGTASEMGASIGILLVDGKDDVVTASFVKRFITIGTLLRRLELLVSSLRARPANEGLTIYSLAHSLSTALDFIRSKLVGCPPSNAQLASGHGILEVWSCYAPYGELLTALAELYGRSEALQPHEYPHLDSSPISLLSRIYEHLTLHFERHSSHLLRSVMAFIFSSTSYEYIQCVAQSIGFGGSPKPKLTYRLGHERRAIPDADGFVDDDDDEEEENIFDLMEGIETDFPTFFPKRLLHLLPVAQKSLVLLRIAHPDHPMLVESGNCGSKSKGEIRWLWREGEIDAAWKGLPLASPATAPATSTAVQPQPASGIVYKPELDAFQIFNFEPGVQKEGIIYGSSKQSTSQSSLQIQSFISSFPTSLPSITPTLPSLISLTFQPLAHHASTLSRTLLDIFITQPGKLYFHTHLVLLKNFILVANPEFKARLVSALFDDAGEFGEGDNGRSLSIKALRRRRREKYSTDAGPIRGEEGKNQGENGKCKMPWAVGLAPHLLERQTWPPVGADLSFFLRTVIVDSLDCGGWEGTAEGFRQAEDREEKGDEWRADNVVHEEAEWRLGFAIRDLPVGTGREKWLDPLSIEALDFLYMDYRPPRPLEILISPEILSKYQRMFTFILRLLRVENALKSLFRMTIHRAHVHTTVIFPTLTKSRKLVLHFRYVAQVFVSSLSGYVFDTIIGGNLDPFLDQLSSSSSPPSTSSLPSTHESGISTSQSKAPAFLDVFDMAKHHSHVLDDILSACLLRSGQKGVGDLLKQTMETVLEFTIVVGELHQGRIEEYQVAPMVEELGRRFGVKMKMLMKVLKGLVEKGHSSANLTTKLAALQGHYFTGPGGASKHHPIGGLEALHHLLLRVDLTDWWNSGKSE